MKGIKLVIGLSILSMTTTVIAHDSNEKYECKLTIKKAMSTEEHSMPAKSEFEQLDKLANDQPLIDFSTQLANMCKENSSLCNNISINCKKDD